MIGFTSVSKRFGDTVVLRDLDLTVETGELLAVIGRSGTGKSTLLRIVAGLDRADSGTVRADGELAVAFQEPRLVPWLRVHDNVTLGLKGATRQTAAAALAEVGLEDKLDAWPLELSGGQAQRVSLARALVHEPSIMLLDEPFGALDALTKIEMQNLVGRLWRDHGWTTVLVTHDVDEAVRLADRVIVLGEGGLTHEIRVPGHGPRDRDDPSLAPIAADLLRALGVITTH